MSLLGLHLENRSATKVLLHSINHYFLVIRSDKLGVRVSINGHLSNFNSIHSYFNPYFFRSMDDKVQKAQRYWKENLTYLGILLSIWFLVSYGAGILFADALNQFRLGGFKLGFWFAQQGSIYIFVVLIFVYVYLMNKLDKKYGYDQE